MAAVTLYSRDVRIPDLRAPAVHVDVPRVFGAGDRLLLTLNGARHEARAHDTGSFSVTAPVALEDLGLHARIDAPPASIDPPVEAEPGSRTVAPRPENADGIS